MSKNKIILAIETSNRNGSLSLLVGNEERVGWVGNAQVSRSEDLLLNIRDLYNKSGILLSETNLVAVSVGPGSFTGLRVGLATAQGIAFALGIGCIGVSALESLAFSIILEEGIETEVLSFISIAHQTGAWQKFKLVNEMIQPLLEPVIGNFEALYSSFVLEKNLRMVAEFDSFVRLLEITGVKDLGPFEQAVSNQAKFVGMIGGLKNEAGIQNEVLPNYLF